jgi:hypothetical protein
MGIFLRSPVLLVGLALLAAFAWRSALALPDGRLHLAVLTCGENAVLYGRAPGRRLRPLYPRIDLLVVPNGDKTTPRGLADLSGRITFGQALLENPDLRIHEPLSRELRRQGAVIHTPAAGQVFDLGDGARLHVLVHGDGGTAVLLEYGNLRVLLPGGAALGELLKAQGALHPSVLVLSGRDLKETGEAHWQQLEPLAIVATQSGEGENWLNLDQLGWVQMVSDGGQMWSGGSTALNSEPGSVHSPQPAGRLSMSAWLR